MIVVSLASAQSVYRQLDNVSSATNNRGTGSLQLCALARKEHARQIKANRR